jgi:hypothetical protein
MAILGLFSQGAAKQSPTMIQEEYVNNSLNLDDKYLV